MTLPTKFSQERAKSVEIRAAHSTIVPTLSQVYPIWSKSEERSRDTATTNYVECPKRVTSVAYEPVPADFSSRRRTTASTPRWSEIASSSVRYSTNSSDGESSTQSSRLLKVGKLGMSAASGR